MDIPDINDISDIQNINDQQLMDLFQNCNFSDEIIQQNEDCPRCHTSEFIVEDYSKGYSVCSSCGLVLTNIIDKAPEWKNGSDNNSDRCGHTINHFLPQSSLGTTIEGFGRSKVKTLNSWNSMPYKEISLNKVLKEIQFRCTKHSILKCIQDDAKILYKYISECRHLSGINKGNIVITRGNNRKSIIAACVFFACKRKEDTRSPKEIAYIFDLKDTEITTGCKNFLLLAKNRRLMGNKNITIDLKSSEPVHFIPRFCRELHIDKKYIPTIIQISSNIQKLGIASIHTPLSVATGSILIVSDIYSLKISKKKISQQFGISEVTIGKTYKGLTPYKSILINDQVTNKLAIHIKDKKTNSIVPISLSARYNKIYIQPS
jgi:transcription initiation factor TFIIIB Brf1 subunit/transcription initiation factor TFIIB